MIKINSLSNLKSSHIDALNSEKKREVLALLTSLNDYQKYNKIKYLYPDTGPFRRELYGKHLEFFAAGKKYQERLNMSGNRCGKTLAGGCETSWHLDGDYPEWWSGRRFDKPTRFWAAGNTSKTTRDIVQLMLMGPVNDIGSGMIPKHRILKTTPAAGGVPNAFDTVYVQHVSGGVSQLGYKSYAEGRKSFEGTEREGIWYDEECPFDVYGEGLMRIATTHGMCYTTFTPLLGLTELVLSFLPQEYSFSEAA